MSARNESSGAALRARAATLLAEIVDSGRSLAAIDIADPDLSVRDQAMLRALLSESLRWHHRFEWVLAELLERPVRPRDRVLGCLLRIGLTQLEILRTPDHAAVSATVAAAPLVGAGHAKGLINAVLRRYLREREDLNRRAMGIDSARFSYPDWLIAAIRQDWPAEFEAVLDAGNMAPPLWLRVNRTKLARDEYLRRLDIEGIDALAPDEFPDAVLLREARPVDEIPGFFDGLVSVQDAAAQYAVELVAPGPGQRVLDACAAPGGKTAHILERCPELEEVVAIDNDPGRIHQVGENLNRLGLAATIREADAAQPDAWFEGRPFDCILLDAPCSATGVIRRNPDIKLLRRASDPKRLGQVQAGMLDALWPLLAPGGRLVFVTCSILRAEGRDVTRAFLERTEDARLPAFASPGHRQFLPGKANTDGFYYACLQKEGE